MKLKQWISCILLIAVLLTALPSGALAADRAGTGEPELQDLTVETASGQTISLLDEPGAIDLEGRYSFTAVFSHPEQVERVYITSTKGGAVRLLEAQWDEHDRAFTTSGFFNGDEDYIPGQIGVEYTIKTQAADIEGEVDWNALQSGLGGQVSAEAGGSAAPGQYTVDLTSLLAAESKVAVNVAVDVFDADTGGNLNDWLGTYQDYETLASYVVEGGSKYIVYLDYSDPSTYAMILKDASGSTFVKMIVGEAGELFGSQTLKRIAEQLDNVSSVSSMAHQLLTVHDSVSELRSQVSGRTDLTGSEKQELNQRIDDYENDRLLFFLTMTALPAVVAASGGTMAGPALVFNALLGVLNAAAGTFWDYRVGMMTGCEPLDTDFTGDAHGVLLTSDLLEEMDNTITESGTYYLDGDTTLEIGAVGGPAVNVVLCKHGYGCNVQVNSGSFLELRDCMYEEDLDGNVVGSYGAGDVTNAGGYVTTQECSISDIINSEDSHVAINGGRVYRILAAGGDVQIGGGNIDAVMGSTNRVGSNAKLLVKGGRIGQIRNDTGTVEISGGRVHSCYNESGTVTITSGVIDGNADTIFYGVDADTAIQNDTEGTLIVIGGTIIGGESFDGYRYHSYPAIENDGTLIIRGGSFTCGDAEGGDTCISSSGSAEIFAGEFRGCILSEIGGRMTIHDGTFRSVGTHNVRNWAGDLIIEGGDFQILEANETYCNVTSYAHAISEAETIIRGGTFYCEDGNCIVSEDASDILHTFIEGGSFYSEAGSCVSNTGEMTISGGTFTAGETPIWQGCVTNSGSGKLSITGGAFICREGSCIYNTGDANITGGHFIIENAGGLSGCVTNAGTGELIIGDGTFTCLDGSPCVYSNDNLNLTISGGTFLAPDGLSVIEGQGFTLLLGENSCMEFSARWNLFDEGLGTDTFQLSVKIVPGYEGGIIYYDSPEGEGIGVTAAQVAAMDFSLSSYLRLECDRSLRGASADGVSVSVSSAGGGLRTATVSSDAIELTPGLRIWAASYADGKMTSVTSGILQADGTVTFSRPLDADTVLFFLDDAGRPMCGTVLLQE